MPSDMNVYHTGMRMFPRLLCIKTWHGAQCGDPGTNALLINSQMRSMTKIAVHNLNGSQSRNVVTMGHGIQKMIQTDNTWYALNHWQRKPKGPTRGCRRSELHSWSEVAGKRGLRLYLKYIPGVWAMRHDKLYTNNVRLLGLISEHTKCATRHLDLLTHSPHPTEMRSYREPIEQDGDI